MGLLGVASNIKQKMNSSDAENRSSPKPPSLDPTQCYHPQTLQLRASSPASDATPQGRSLLDNTYTLTNPLSLTRAYGLGLRHVLTTANSKLSLTNVQAPPLFLTAWRGLGIRECFYRLQVLRRDQRLSLLLWSGVQSEAKVLRVQGAVLFVEILW